MKKKRRKAEFVAVSPYDIPYFVWERMIAGAYRGLERTLDNILIEISWRFSDERKKAIRKARRLNAKFGGKKVLDRRTRGGKYLYQKYVEFIEREQQRFGLTKPKK